MLYIRIVTAWNLFDIANISILHFFFATYEIQIILCIRWLKYTDKNIILY